MGYAMPIASALLGRQSQVSAINASNRALAAQGAQVVQSYNYSVANSQIERNAAFTAAVDKMQSAKKQGSANLATVQAALGESIGGGGRTGKAIETMTQADTNEAVNSYLDAYVKASQSIDLSNEQNAISTNNRLAGLQSQVQEGPSALSTLLNIGTGVLSYKQQQEQIQLERQKAGIGGRSWSPTLGTKAGGQYIFDASSLNPYAINRSSMNFTSGLYMANSGSNTQYTIGGGSANPFSW